MSKVDIRIQNMPVRVWRVVKSIAILEWFAIAAGIDQLFTENGKHVHATCVISHHTNRLPCRLPISL